MGRIRHVLTNINPEDHTAICSACGETKAYLHKNKRRSTWRCYNKSFRNGSKEKYKNNSEFRAKRKIAERKRYNDKKHAIRERFMKLVYNLTPEQYDKILAFQNGVCAITGKPPVNQKLHIDHDHKSGLIRGIISWRVNHALAAFDDSPELLRRAADYLENPSAISALGVKIYGVLGKAKLKKKMVYGHGN